MGRIIGIDLGTTNSEASVLEAGRPVIIPSAEGGSFGGKNFPSVVAFAKDGTLLVGEPAKRQAVLNPERTLMRIKRKMGTDYRVTIDDKTYTPEQISAFVLQKIKRDAEQYLGEEVTEAVITVPAYFDDNQRTATKAAGEIAGLKVKRIINEPTAAALAYGLDKEGSATIAVYDFGGGTLDVTIMEMGDGVFEVKSTSGDTHLGGSDMDDALVRWAADRFKNEQGVDLTRDRGALQRIRDAVERAKHELTTSVQATINLPYLVADAKGPKHLEYTLTRAQLEEIVRPIVERTRGPVMQALADAKLTKEQVDKVILVGGPTRMPVVQTFVEELFGKKPVRGVDPMQCVAVGAAIQGAILSGQIDKEIVLLDVTPLTLGIETLGGVATALIPRNTTIPTKKSQIFSTAADFQPMVEVHALQGERPMARDNRSLGRFHLDGIPPAPRGVPQIEVTFDIDSNGILTVRAKDLGTKKEQHITVTGSTRLPSDEVERMREEAEKFKEEDEKRRKVIEARNTADSAAYQAERFLADSKEKLDTKDVQHIEKAIKNLREALATEDLARITEMQNALQQAMTGPVTKMYKDAAEQAQKQQPPADGTKGTKKPDGEPNDPAFDADYDVKP